MLSPNRVVFSVRYDDDEGKLEETMELTPTVLVLLHWFCIGVCKVQFTKHMVVSYSKIV